MSLYKLCTPEFGRFLSFFLAHSVHSDWMQIFMSLQRCSLFWLDQSRTCILWVVVVLKADASSQSEVLCNLEKVNYVSVHDAEQHHQHHASL